MVKDTRTALRPHLIRLNEPEPVSISEDPAGRPLALKGRCPQAVQAVEESWRLDDEWWRREPVARLYYRVRLAAGPETVLFQDLMSGAWYRQRG
jgi:hypothetical protein